MLNTVKDGCDVASSLLDNILLVNDFEDNRVILNKSDVNIVELIKTAVGPMKIKVILFIYLLIYFVLYFNIYLLIGYKSWCFIKFSTKLFTRTREFNYSY